MSFQAWIRAFKLLRMIRLYQWYKRKVMHLKSSRECSYLRSILVYDCGDRLGHQCAYSLKHNESQQCLLYDFPMQQGQHLQQKTR